MAQDALTPDILALCGLKAAHTVAKIFEHINEYMPMNAVSKDNLV
jgi:hypothetical protein